MQVSDDVCSTTNSNDSIFRFSFDECHTPVVTSISRNQGTTEDVITIFGKRFSCVYTDNYISFGDAICTVIASTANHINCSINQDTSPSIGIRQTLSLRVENLCDALIKIHGTIAKSFVIEPFISVISSKLSSTNGELVLTIRGSGFHGNESNVVTSIDGHECDIQSITYTEILCLTPQHLPGNKTVSVYVRVGYSAIPAICSSDCILLFNEDTTPVVYDILPKMDKRN